MSFDRAAFDQRVLDALAQGRVDDATTDVIKTYGPEVYTLLVSVHKRREDADDVFSMFCEKLWKGLRGFQGRASVRTWVYTIAWSASSTFHTHKATRREDPITDAVLAELVARVRTETLSRMRAPESRLRTLRQSLPLEDQTLLVLRVERELSFRELAIVMNADAALAEHALEREAARLRKRYQLVKTRLRELIRANESAD
jgi:RNA polymerase sigma-70 factor, ECF subfamily